MTNKKNTAKKTKKLEVPIEGMHCASCALNVENSINKLDGAKAEVDINTNRARVEYDSEKIAISDIDKVLRMQNSVCENLKLL